MMQSTRHNAPHTISPPALAAGLAALAAVGLVAASPLGPAIASAFLEGWLAVFLDAQLFRVLCL